jgi:cobalt/nickel transport system ATP-binding protein
MAAMIELDDVCYAYDHRPVLRHVDLTVDAGETVLLWGDNGAGKSTLLKLLNGLIFPEKGCYRFEGRDITSVLMKEHVYAKWYHQRVAFLWQNPDVQLFCASVAEELAFGPQQMGLPEDEVEHRVADALDLFGIAHLRQRAPYYLSGGEKKKTAMAALFTMNPSVWTMDEPTGALDEKSRYWLADFLQALKKAGKTLVIAGHDKEFLGDMVDKQLILRR